MACGTTISAAVTSITLNSNLNTAGPFQLLGGSINIGAYQWFCSTFTSTGATATSITSSAGGGITVTGNSGTVVNCTKTTAQLTFPGTKPTLTLTASGTASGRTIIWNGSTWATNSNSMPGLKITNGSDTVTFTGYATSPSFYNLNLFDCTGFGGNFSSTTSPSNYWLVYGDFVFPTTAGTVTNMTGVALYGTGSFYANCPSTTFQSFSGIAGTYVQTGPLNVGSINASEPITLNGTLTSTGFLNFSKLILSGTVSVTTSYSSGTILVITNATSLTSLTVSSPVASLSSTPTITAPITFTSTVVILTLSLTTTSTISFGTLTSLNFVNFSSSQVINATTNTFQSNIVNIPSTSVININTPTGGSSDVQLPSTCTNKFTVNLSIASTGNAYVYSQSGVSAGQDLDLVVTGSGTLSFQDSGSNYLTAYLASLDTSAYTGGAIGGTVYLKNSLVQSSTGNDVISAVYLYTGATGTFTLNTRALKDFNGSASSQDINITSPNLSISGSTVFIASSGTLFLNSCVISIGFAGEFRVLSPTVLNSGTSTFNLTNAYINAAGQALNVVNFSGTTGSSIKAASINTIANLAQPATVNIFSDIVFTNFNVNGTSGNLVTVNGYPSTVRTLTKPSAWTLANSTETAGTNTGLTFGSTGNNSFLNVSYINGVTSGVLSTGNFFLLF